MKLQANEFPFHHIILEDTYTDEELKWIWKELDILSREGVLQPPNISGSAVDSNGKLLKDNLALFLDDAYPKREMSPMLSYNRKLFRTEILNQPTLWFFTGLAICKDYTLLSYYEDNHHYHPHTDRSTVTALTWFYREPKKFTGGALYFPDHNYTLECKTNNTLLFPSQIRHSVTAVQMLETSEEEKLGRYCMSQFFHPW